MATGGYGILPSLRNCITSEQLNWTMQRNNIVCPWMTTMVTFFHHRVWFAIAINNQAHMSMDDNWLNCYHLRSTALQHSWEEVDWRGTWSGHGRDQSTHPKHLPAQSWKHDCCLKNLSANTCRSKKQRWTLCHIFSQLVATKLNFLIFMISVSTHAIPTVLLYPENMQ
jgi:hypothetical protein